MAEDLNRPNTHKNNGGEDQTVDPATQQYRSMYASKEEIENLIGDKLTDEEYEAIKKAFPDPGELRDSKEKEENEYDYDEAELEAFLSTMGLPVYVDLEEGVESAAHQVMDQIEEYFTDEVMQEWAENGYEIDVTTFEDEYGFRKNGDFFLNMLSRYRYGSLMAEVISEQEFSDYETIIKQLGDAAPFYGLYDDDDDIKLNSNISNSKDLENNKYAKVYRGLYVENEDSKNSFESLRNIIKSYAGKYETKGFLIRALKGTVIYNSLSKLYSKENYTFSSDQEGVVGNSDIVEFIADLNDAIIYEPEKIEYSSDGRKIYSAFLFRTTIESRKNEMINRLYKHFKDKGMDSSKLSENATRIINRLSVDYGYQAVFMGADFTQLDKQLDALNIGKLKMKEVK